MDDEGGDAAPDVILDEKFVLAAEQAGEDILDRQAGRDELVRRINETARQQEVRERVEEER